MKQPRRRKKSPARTCPRINELDCLFLELTTKCNLYCIHCYADSGPELPMTRGMTVEKWSMVLEQGYAAGCERVQFIGGEPTLYPGLLKLIDYARNIGYKVIEVYTNGTLLKEPMFEAFQRCEVYLAFSVYGSTAAIHDEITQRPGSFGETIENIRRSLELGIPVRVNITQMNENSADIEDTQELLSDMGVETIAVDRLRGIGRGNIALQIQDPMEEMCDDCGRGQLAVDSAGNVFPCVFSRYYRLGHISAGLESILEEESLHSFRRRMRARENLH